MIISTLANNAEKVKFFIKGFFSKCDQIRSFLRIWSHLLKKSLMKNFIFCALKPQSYKLNHFMPPVSFFTLYKNLKPSSFLMFTGGIERDWQNEWVNEKLIF